MYMAIPGAPAHSNTAPNWGTSRIYRDLYFRSGILTYPLFLDNFFIGEKERANLPAMRRHLQAFGKFGLVRFGVLPDYEPEEALKLKKEYPEVNWIWVLHKLDEDVKPFEWVGFPHKKERRDYSLTQFIRKVGPRKKWYLGLWDVGPPNRLTFFDGFDTLIPVKVAQAYHSRWITWGQRERAHSDMSTIELLNFNISNFKNYILENIITPQYQSKLGRESVQ